ncbi:ABC transporter permease [Brockia lithotrophica]|uniref:Peptide/nickel transport system permease protein n=1 Tax=Brockia lithotrophica TaxID=933949 RepID=A0A660L5B0_9BACL|nr:ABC transporter permease [Brockia lithotrophica]RKQ89117.1 peptide/nickel transport system permease protein [Brockia lithotrophica]
MWRYVVRRLLESIPTFIGASIVIFLAYSLAPGDVFTSRILNDTNITPERIAELRALYGLDQPLYLRYLHWMGQVLRGDLGISYMFQKPVTEVIQTFMWNSFLIAATVMFFEWLFALFIGFFSALKQYSWFDSLVTLFVYATMSFPSFFLGLLLLKWLAVDIPIFPLGGMTTTGSDFTGWEHILDVAHHMVLPVLTLTLLSIGGLTRYVRANVLEVIRQDFVRTARAKGLRERIVLQKHVFRNVLLPLITLFTLELPGLFAGAMITEQIFNWPGIGKVALSGVYNRDYPLVMGFTLFLAVLTILANILADVLYGVADPRVRHR